MRSPRPVSATLVAAICVMAALALVAGSCGDGDDSADETTTTTDERVEGEAAPELTAPTIDELLARDEPLLLAHAGGDHDAPQETIYAYTTAAEAGVDVLEMDVMLSADGELVVHHDETVDRLTDGSGAVAELTLDELRELDAAYWWSPDCTDGTCRDLPESDYPYRGVRTGEVDPPEGFSAEDFRIPTFREVAEAFPGLPLDVEVKGEGEPAFEAADVLAAELEELERVDSTVVVSFDSKVVERMRERLPEVTTSPGLSTMTEWVLRDGPIDGYPIVQIPPTYQGADLLGLVLPKAMEAGIEVWVWPTEAEQETTEFYRELIDRDVDGVIAASPSAWPHDGD